MRLLIWRNPEQQMQNGQFWLVFETCLNKLPVAQALDALLDVPQFPKQQQITHCGDGGVYST